VREKTREEWRFLRDDYSRDDEVELVGAGEVADAGVADAGRLVRRDDVVPHAHLRRFRLRLRLRRRGQWVQGEGQGSGEEEMVAWLVFIGRCSSP
jgi:hypothetical protein